MTKKLEHVAIIMDGNGRWAKKRKLPISYGHTKGVERVEDTIKVAIRNNIKYLTVFAFSTENWNRSKKEIQHLMKLIKKFYKEKRQIFNEEGIKFNPIGSRKNVPDEILKIFDDFATETKHNDRLIFNFAFNYGAKLEIVDAVNSIINQGYQEVDENIIEKHLYTHDQPDVDLLVRTSGEQRVSNFLLWQIAYAEFIFVDCLWPDFTQDEFQVVINQYYQRERRFGGR